MSTPLAGMARTQRNRFERIQSEIEAALVFAAAAIEYSKENDRSSAETCLNEAEDCRATAMGLIQQTRFTEEQLQEFKSMLDELQSRLNVSRGTKVASIAAA